MMRTSKTSFSLYQKPVKKCQTIVIEAVNPELLLADATAMSQIKKMVTEAFTFHHQTIYPAYMNSSNQELFLALSDEQAEDSVRQIAKANEAQNGDGIILIARDNSKPEKPIVGMASGVRNGHKHPSDEYMGRLFSSDCGLGNAIGSCFSSVIHHFDMKKMDEHTNVFMLAMVTVSPAYMRQGIANNLFASIQNEMMKWSYDGFFSIATSKKFEELLNKHVAALPEDTNKTYMPLQSEGNSLFFAIALNEKGVKTFNQINEECRHGKALELK